MPLPNAPEVVAGGLLVFFVPGYALAKATFPEWRVRGREALLRLLELVTLGFVLSVVLTVLVGYALLAAAPGGFQAYWTDPLLEAVLAGIAVVAFLVGWLRGAYAREPPEAAAADEVDTGDAGAWELSRELDRLAREERRIRHELRVTGKDSPEARRLAGELDRVGAERAALQQRREAEYAS
jgi:uncharacterized membrane protein